MPKAMKEYSQGVHLRVSAAEKTALTTLADREGVSESDVIRRLIRAGSGLPLPVANIDHDIVTECSDQMRKIGVNLNQAVRAMNEGRVGYDASMLKALQMLSRAVIEQREIIGQMLKPIRRRRPVKA